MQKFNWKTRIIKSFQLTEVSEKIKNKKKKIVYTAGAWDMLHVGQIRYLQQAKQLGDVLIVGVSSNQAIRKIKGQYRPILDEQIRAEMMTYVRFVDLVTIVNDISNQPTIALLKPDVYVTVKESWNADYKKSDEYKTIKKNGGEIKLINRQSPYISTTQILKRSVGAQLNDVFKDLVKIGKKPLREKK